ncbi:MAG TPA: MMPL family transporter [Thermoleophilaceae bacterium]|nr:MMPL family transporter [Thermoleophilaceae bacterium]
MGEIFERVVRAVVRRPAVPLVAIAVLAVAATLLALRLEPSTGTDTLVSKGSESFQETERFKREFGDDAVVVLVKGDLRGTLLSADLSRLIQLEDCLAGKAPERALRTLPAACRELAKLKPAQVVLGPGTFVNTSVERIGEELGRRLGGGQRQANQADRAARKRAADQGLPPEEQARLGKQAREGVTGDLQRQLFALALRYGITSLPAVDSPEFVSALAFESDGKTPKARFSYLFPSDEAALVQMRLRPDLSDAERARTIDLVRAATGDERFQPEQGARYVVTGVPVVVDALGDAVRDAIPWLLGAAILIMAATLGLVFRTRLRLLPLALALAASAITFGALALVGGQLTMASIAVLPVLIGLAVDYAIQFQARYDELRSRYGDAGGRSRSAGPGGDPPPAEIAAAAARVGGPTIATAGLATAIGFLVLLSSPVPMVRGFGALLVVGIFVALACALLAGFAALVRFGAPRPRPADLPPSLLRAAAGRLGRTSAWTALARGWRRLRLGTLERGERALATAIAHPRRVLAIGLALAVVGWAADTQSTVVSDVRELVPADLQALRDIDELQEETGVSGEIDVTVRADDVTKPEVVRWMASFQDAVLKDAGYSAGARCTQVKDPPELCPALSLTDVLGAAPGGDERQVSALLEAIPDYLSQGVVTRDRKTANLAFGIRLQSLDRQQEVVEAIERRLDPPPGVEASVVGLPVLVADSNAQLSSPLRRMLLLLAALVAVFAVLFAVRRNARDAAIPLIPIALATGWSGGIMFLLGLLPGPLEVELNPMSVTLGALVIAISTEFSVLLSARYRQEREGGASTTRALETTYASTGAAVMASGLTAIAGFAALAASDIRMLRDFGILTVVDLSVSLIGVMLLLPAALVWAERHGPFTLRDLDPRRALHGVDAARLPRPSLRALRARRRDA